MRAMLLGLVVVGSLCVIPVRPLSDPVFFKRNFQRCFLYDSQAIPSAMTVHSFIDIVQRMEEKYFGYKAQAHLSALAFLSWFSLPDLEQYEDLERHNRLVSLRYRFIQKLFATQLRSVADKFSEAWNKVYDQASPEDQQEACFMMRALSHSYENSCALENYSNSPKFFPSGSDPRTESRRKDSPVNQERGVPPGNDMNDEHQRGHSRLTADSRSRITSHQGAVPKLRNAQAQLHSFPPSDGRSCKLREVGVVSISGHPNDAVSIAPVLMGIAASRMTNDGDFDYMRELRSVERCHHLEIDGREVDPVVMATVGQEIGYATYLRSAEKLKSTQRVNLHRDDIRGQWNQTGCLSAFDLNTEGPVAFTRAQMTGAIDGLILGKFGLRNENKLSDMSLASLLRLYYASHRMTFSVSSQSDALSVCNRDALYRSFEPGVILNEGKLMASFLAYENPNFSSTNDFAGDLDETFRAVSTDRIPRGGRDDLCTGGNLEKCSNPADLFVILDPTPASIETKDRQANILGRIVNGIDFRLRRNSVRVYSGISGNRLRLFPDFNDDNNNNNNNLRQSDMEGFTASGHPACIAQFANIFHSSGRPIGERELFIAINGTFNHIKSQPLSASLPATAGRVVLYFRMSVEPVQDAQSAAEALISLRITHPKVKIIAIGDELVLGQINDWVGGLEIYPAVELDGEIMAEASIGRGSSERSPLSDLRRAICETPLNLQPASCSEGTRRTPSGMNQAAMSGSGREFFSGVIPGHVQFVSIDSKYFAGGRDKFTVQFSSGVNGRIKVCELSSEYQYVNPNSQIANTDSGSWRDHQANEYCQETTPSSKSVSFVYPRLCYDGPRSCSSLRYAVVGLQSAQASATCRGEFCESPVSVIYSVKAENMVCASSPLMASISVIGLSLIAVRRLA